MYEYAVVRVVSEEARRGRQTPLTAELQTVVNDYVDSGNRTWVISVARRLKLKKSCIKIRSNTRLLKIEEYM